MVLIENPTARTVRGAVVDIQTKEIAGRKINRRFYVTLSPEHSGHLLWNLNNCVVIIDGDTIKARTPEMRQEIIDLLHRTGDSSYEVI